MAGLSFVSGTVYLTSAVACDGVFKTRLFDELFPVRVRIEVVVERLALDGEHLGAWPVWCKYSNEVYDIVIKQHCG